MRVDTPWRGVTVGDVRARPLRLIELWSIRSARVVDVVRDKGVLRGDEAHVDPVFLPAYRWMIGEMKTRIPGYDGKFPVWAWARKPDMRRVGHRPIKESLVRIGFRADPERILVSDFDAWHSILNGHALALNEREWEASELWTRAQVEASWQRVFDLEVLARADRRWRGHAPPVLQATVGEIRASDVFRVEVFHPRRHLS